MSGAKSLSRVRLEDSLFHMKNSQDPPGAKPLLDIIIKMIVATGTFDESSTNKIMGYVAQYVPGGTLTEFDAAHMVNLECSIKSNDWAWFLLGAKRRSP